MEQQTKNVLWSIFWIVFISIIVGSTAYSTGWDNGYESGKSSHNVYKDKLDTCNTNLAYCINASNNWKTLHNTLKTDYNTCNSNYEQCNKDFWLMNNYSKYWKGQTDWWINMSNNWKKSYYDCKDNNAIISSSVTYTKDDNSCGDLSCFTSSQFYISRLTTVYYAGYNKGYSDGFNR